MNNYNNFIDYAEAWLIKNDFNFKVRKVLKYKKIYIVEKDGVEMEWTADAFVVGYELGIKQFQNMFALYCKHYIKS